MREKSRQSDPYPEERDSFHYRTLEKERERIREGGEEGGGSFLLQNPRAETCPMVTDSYSSLQDTAL